MLKLLRPLLINVNIKTETLKSCMKFTSNATMIDKEVDSDEPVEMPNPFQKEKIKCVLCVSDIVPNYKNVQLLSQFQSPYTGRIYGRHITGLCKRQQEIVEKEIHKAQVCALMPAFHKDMKFIDDPKLFNPERPIRPHKY